MKLRARDGDVLVVAYPESKIALARGSYTMVGVGGLIYTRRLVDGEDPDVQYAAIYAFLRERAIADGKAKVAEFLAELQKGRS